MSDERVKLNEAVAKGSIPKQAPNLGGAERGEDDPGRLGQFTAQKAASLPHPMPHLSLRLTQLGPKCKTCANSQSPKGP